MSVESITLNQLSSSNNNNNNNNNNNTNQSLPVIPMSTIEMMIQFNNQLHKDTNIHKKYGSEGRPWEFNLRDLFRWCELIVFHSKDYR